MKKYFEIEIDIFMLPTEDIIRTSPDGGDDPWNPGGDLGEDELPFMPAD